MVGGSIVPCTVGLNPMERYTLYWRMAESHSQPESGGEKKFVPLAAKNTKLFSPSHNHASSSYENELV